MKIRRSVHVIFTIHGFPLVMLGPGGDRCPLTELGFQPFNVQASLQATPESHPIIHSEVLLDSPGTEIFPALPPHTLLA